RWAEVGRSAQEPWDVLRQNVEHFARGITACATLCVRRKYRQMALPAIRQFAPLHLVYLSGEFRILGAVSFEELRPCPAGVRTARSDSVLAVLVAALSNQRV